jgi:hypothetical protein
MMVSWLGNINITEVGGDAYSMGGFDTVVRCALKNLLRR